MEHFFKVCGHPALRESEENDTSIICLKIMSSKIDKLLCPLKSMNRVPSTSSIISVSIGDILLLRDDLPTETQFITIARLMDVIEYFKSPNTYDFN